MAHPRFDDVESPAEAELLGQITLPTDEVVLDSSFAVDAERELVVASTSASLSTPSSATPPVPCILLPGLSHSLQPAGVTFGILRLDLLFIHCA